MSPLFHRLTGLSIALAGIIPGASHATAPASSAWYGRWIVSEERPVFTARGQLYKTVDIAPCGNDFCGISVTDAGRCGPTLFRFLGRRATSSDALRGHGRWGAGQKNVMIFAYDDDTARPVSRSLELYLGDGYDFGGRSDNMPKFHGEYRRTSSARCTTR